MKPHPPDYNIRPIAVIPALTRGWRIILAIKCFPIILVLVYWLGFLILGKNYHLDDFNNFSQNFNQMLQDLNQHQWLIAIPAMIATAVTLFIYDPFSKYFYKWWFAYGG